MKSKYVEDNQEVKETPKVLAAHDKFKFQESELNIIESYAGRGLNIMGLTKRKNDGHISNEQYLASKLELEILLKYFVKEMEASK